LTRPIQLDFGTALFLWSCKVAPNFVFRRQQNPRLAAATPAQLNNIELSPFGLHWPDLDEDLSIRGIAQGDYGQGQKAIAVDRITQGGSACHSQSSILHPRFQASPLPAFLST
jgi:hypothetical protein